MSAHGQGGATFLSLARGFLVLALLTGCLHRDSAASWSVETSRPDASWNAPFSAVAPAALFDDAVERRIHGDLEGAIARLTWLRLAGDDSPATLYQLGIAYELDERFTEALGVYDLLLTELDDSPLQYDAYFRRGLTHEALGDTRSALRDYRRIPDHHDWERQDRYTLDLIKGGALLAADREHAGRTLVLSALKATEGTGEVSWARGRGLYALAEHTLGEAGEIPLRGGQGKLAHRVRLRLEAIERADNYMVHVVRTEEPEWILAGLLVLGDAWLDLHDDLLAAPMPKGLSRWQEDHYRQLLADQIQRFRTRAWSVYDQGLGVAGTYRVENRYTRALRHRRDTIQL